MYSPVVRGLGTGVTQKPGGYDSPERRGDAHLGRGGFFQRVFEKLEKGLRTTVGMRDGELLERQKDNR